MYVCFISSFTCIYVCFRLTIKGDLNEEAVLCTASTTYAIKYVSTSNTVLLIPPGGYTNSTQDIAGKGCDVGADINADSVGPPTANVLATIPGYLELVETAPRLDKLKLLLNERPYTEELDEEQVCFLSYKHRCLHIKLLFFDCN